MSQANNYPTASFVMGTLSVNNLLATNQQFTSASISELEVLDQTTLRTSVNILVNTFNTNEPLATYDKNGNLLYTMPSTEPLSNQILTCSDDGSSNLIWTTGGGTGGTGGVQSIINTDGNIGVTGTSNVTINLANDIKINGLINPITVRMD